MKGEALDLALFATVLDSMMQGIAVFDANLRLLLFNRSYGELFEYPPGFLQLGMRYEEILCFDAARDEYGGGGSETHIRERLARARVCPAQPARHELVRPGGTVLALHRAPTPGGGFIDTYTDITQRKKAEEEARRNADFLRSAIENMADGVRVFDKDLRLVAWNRRAFEMLGFPEDLARAGTPYASFLDFTVKRGDYAGGPENPLAEKLVRARNPTVWNKQQTLPNGRIIDKWRSPMPGGGFVSVYRDVTERQRLEQAKADQARELAKAIDGLKVAHAEMIEAKERAELANRAKSEFLANMSHELRTPLNAIIGFAEVMEAEIMGPIGRDCYRGYVRDIKNSGTHLLGIISDILDLSKIEAGRATLQESTFELPRVIRTCLKLIDERARLASVQIRSDVAADLPLILADERKLKQILINLLSNAVKFTPAGGHVTIGAYSRGGEGIVLTVTDTGIGIAASDIPKALTPFIQVDNSLSRRFEGTGLGLPLVDSLTRLHGGTLTIESELGKGTTVTVSLPANRVVAAVE